MQLGKDPVFAQGGENSAGGEDLLRERRERTQMRVTGRPTKQTGGEIEGHGIPIANKSKSVVGFEHGNAEVDAIPEEDPGEALRDDPADAVLRQSGDRVLARAPAAEVLAADEEVACRHLF